MLLALEMMEIHGMTMGFSWDFILGLWNLMIYIYIFIYLSIYIHMYVCIYIYISIDMTI